MSTTASLDTRLHGLLLDELRQLREDPGVGRGQNAVAEVEDVRAALRGVEHRLRTGLDPLPRPEQDGGIEVSLDRAIMRHGLEREPPVDADHVAAGAGERTQQLLGGAGAEMDRRYVDRGEDACAVRRDELLVVGRRERADPRVEELD